MRLWSLHPSYLDSKGLVALWREGLLAQKVLQGLTKGYRNHPQLERFKQQRNPEAAIATYMYEIFLESKRRGYSFDGSKIISKRTKQKIPVTNGQLAYEIKWLTQKLTSRDPKYLKSLNTKVPIRTHPLFIVIEGEIEPWEKL